MNTIDILKQELIELNKKLDKFKISENNELKGTLGSMMSGIKLNTDQDVIDYFKINNEISEKQKEINTEHNNMMILKNRINKLNKFKDNMTAHTRLVIPLSEFHTVYVYSPTNELLGTIDTETQFYEIRCQIKEKNLGSGYYFIYNDNKILMNEYGQIQREHREFVPFKYEEYLNRLMS